MTEEVLSIPELQTQEIDQLPSSFSKDVIYLDADKIVGDLQLRHWEIGDRIDSIGLKGSQLISDIISDLKLPANEKRKVIVLHDDATIHWCVGYKIGRKAIATDQSSSKLQCSIYMKSYSD